MSLRLSKRELACKVEEVQDLCTKVKDEIFMLGDRAFMPVQFIIARKVLTLHYAKDQG